MNSGDLPSDVDSRLRVVLKRDMGVAYLTGNSHVLRGRMSAFHESGHDITIEKSDIEEASEAAAIWIDGFLAGSEPPPPDYGHEEDEPAWYEERARYRETGITPRRPTGDPV